MKRIKTADQLKLFLEAVAKEATIKAKDKLMEDIDQEVEYFARGLKTTKRNQSGYSKMMPLVEVEDEEEEGAEDPVVAGAPEETEPSSEPAPEPKARNKAEIDIPLVEAEPEFEDIIRALGWIRAGASVKGDMKKELQAYIESLGMPELKALYAMLSSIANILHKEITGDKGQDPEDPPLNLVIDDPEAEEESKQKDTSSSEPASTKDDDAPIKVGQAQSLNEMRRLVRSLMSK